MAPVSALPLGATRKLDESMAGRVEMTTANLLYSILAVSQAATPEQLTETNIAGLIYVYVFLYIVDLSLYFNRHMLGRPSTRPRDR